MSQPFPCPLELTVASTLLLLSTTPTSVSLHSSDFQDDKSFEEESSNVKCCRVTSLSSSDSKSCSSSLERDVSFEEFGDWSMRIDIDDVVSETRRSDMKLKGCVFFAACFSSIKRRFDCKVSRKSRSKILRKISFGKVAHTYTTGTESTVASCVSSSSVSSARSRYTSSRRIGSKHIRRQAEAILKFLSGDPRCSEVKIRQALGDSPDTSKALRMLLKQDEVKRSGTGGRQDPYVYTLA